MTFKPGQVGDLPLLKRIFDINCAPGMWHIQYEVGGPFIAQRKPLQDKHLIKHLRGEYAIATRPLTTTRWAIFDLDCHEDQQPKSLLERVDLITRKIGRNYLTHDTPRGVHLYYKVNALTPESLHESFERKLGVPVYQPGYIELYPKIGRVFRLPSDHGFFVLASLFNSIMK